MVKSGDKRIEEEVIKTSRELYCRPREVVEREINEWSEMSLGDHEYSTSGSGGNLEKFPIVCSLCGLEKTVPFKPEPGRPAYCKECIAKIKSGEVKVEKKGKDQIAYDESKFYKPLADLGIEFEQKDREREVKGIPVRELAGGEVNKTTPQTHKPSIPASKPSVFGAIKKVFTKPKHVRPVGGDNLALKEVLNKSLPMPVSLDSLKNKTQEVKKPIHSNVDRAATSEDMNKLKDLITTATAGQTEKTKVKASPVDDLQRKEVPEDVLKKVLE
jgi:CxxC-x17-CxxC domain-containing protein